MPAIVRTGMMFVHSIREIFVCSLRKTFGQLSDRAKKIVRISVVTSEHYINNKVFVSPVASISHVRACGARLQHVDLIFMLPKLSGFSLLSPRDFPHSIEGQPMDLDNN
jgi:hypothetical protein